MDVDEDVAADPLIKACEDGDLTLAQALLKDGSSLTFCDSRGRTPFLSACWGGHVEIVDALLKAGADPSVLDSEGYGCGLLAAESGNVELLSLLVDSGRASLDDCAEDGATPLLCAAAGGSTEMLNWLLDRGDTDASLLLAGVDDRGADVALIAAENGKVDVLKALRKRGVEIGKSCDDSGCGVLHFAAAGGDLAAVRYCMETLRLPSNARDQDGDTPLIVAAHEGHVAVVEYLMQHGSTPEERNNAGVSAHMAALAGEQHGVVETLNRLVGEDYWMQEVTRHPELVFNIIERGAPTEMDLS